MRHVCVRALVLNSKRYNHSMTLTRARSAPEETGLLDHRGITNVTELVRHLLSRLDSSKSTDHKKRLSHSKRVVLTALAHFCECVRMDAWKVLDMSNLSREPMQHGGRFRAIDQDVTFVKFHSFPFGFQSVLGGHVLFLKWFSCVSNSAHNK